MTRLTGLAGILIISFSAIFVRLADVSPITAAFFRVAYALPVLLVIRLFVTDHRTPRQRLLALVAGALFSIDITLWHTSIEFIGAGLSTVVANSQVLWVGLLAWVLLGERPSRTAFAVVPVVLVGIALIGGLGRADAYGEEPLLGALLSLGAGVAYSVFLLVLRAANTEDSHPVGPLLDAGVGSLLILLVVGQFDSGFSLAFSWPSHGWLLALGVVVHAIGWVMISLVLPRLPALETSVMLLLQPAMTVLWAQLLFTETLSAIQWTGMALAFGGIVLAGLRGVSSVTRSAAPATPDP